jgi:Fur family iron response transcriptional regulator
VDGFRGPTQECVDRGGPRSTCPLARTRLELGRVGLRATRQRVALGWLLFGREDRHVTAAMLYNEANRAGLRVSLGTVHNTLRQFAAAGLIRQIAVPGQTAYFDTRVSGHPHFLIEGEGLVDAPLPENYEIPMPAIPPGYKVARIDLIVRLRRAEEVQY